MSRKITFSQLMDKRGYRGSFRQPLNCVVCNKGCVTNGGNTETVSNLLLDRNGYYLLDSLNNKLIIRVM